MLVNLKKDLEMVVVKISLIKMDLTMMANGLMTNHKEME